MMCGTHEFVDNRDLDVRGMCEFFEKSRDKSGTSCPNIMDWREAFEGADEILAVTISSGMSASYSACVQAMEEYLEEHPGVKGFAMDSLATGPGMRILVDRALELIHQGLTFDEMVQELSEL